MIKKVYSSLFRTRMPFLIFTLCLFPYFPRISFAQEHDFELWTWESLSIDISKIGLPDNTQLYLENVNRFDRDASYLFQFHQRLGIQFDLPWLPNWTLMPVWQHVDYEPGNDEERFHLDLGYSRNRIFDSDWSFKFRFRFDIRNFHAQDGITERYRPMIQFSHPLPLTIQDRPISFYIMNEINYDTAINRFNRHRFGTGLKFPLFKHMSWTLGYQLETNRVRKNLWDSDNMLMTGVDFKF